MIMATSLVAAAIVPLAADAQRMPGRATAAVAPAAPAADPRTRMLQDRIQSDEFIQAEQAGDITAMRRLLAGTGATVPMPPVNFPTVCVAPNWHWVWGYESVTDASGMHWEYKLICQRTRTLPNSPAYPHLPDAH